MRDSTAPGYDERLGVPLRWWVQGFMFTASVWLAVLAALPGSAAWTVTGVTGLLVATLFWSYGSARISVHDGLLRAGRARIEARHLGTVDVLDPEQARRAAGVDADARAYLLLRPYLKRAVRVAITDTADPAPYWLISTRHPDELARALAALREAPTAG
ncbi:DUF3093 domain-containing protein [Nocardioides sp. W7]|uniref:DUF3093 domain-containing protein n=1 Tax=Nocardioides sp. W7 TaxID=2931390 RepID=UPI001FD1BAB2|nr:DUF3093 domain-containing protein [Nocardioides sp. W7]